jgi:hypothetical protein
MPFEETLKTLALLGKCRFQPTVGALERFTSALESLCGFGSTILQRGFR